MTSEDVAARTLSEERSLSPMRRTIANRLQDSYREAVHVTVSREFDAEGLVAAAEAADRAHDVGVSVLDVVLAGVSAALDAHPAFNATFEDDVHRLFAEHNLGVAVSIEAGLVAPVIADVGSLSIAEIAAERRRLTDLVQAGDHAMSDLRGGTFTVSNLGPLGVDAFSPIINPPEIAILGVNRIRERAVPHDGEVAVRRQLSLDLTFDHRVVDGADAARFLDTLVAALESPDELA